MSTRRRFHVSLPTLLVAVNVAGVGIALGVAYPLAMLEYVLIAGLLSGAVCAIAVPATIIALLQKHKAVSAWIKTTIGSFALVLVTIGLYSLLIMRVSAYRPIATYVSPDGSAIATISTSCSPFFLPIDFRYEYSAAVEIRASDGGHILAKTQWIDYQVGRDDGSIHGKWEQDSKQFFVYATVLYEPEELGAVSLPSD